MEHRAVAEAKTNISMGWLIAQMMLFVVVGMPLVAYLWETLNDLLQLQADRTQLLIAVPVLLVFAGWLYLLARWVRRWTASSVH